jgi:hypothetical protein
VQLVHGDADDIIKYPNHTEAIKQWSALLGLSTTPTTTDTGVSLGTHEATRQRWKNDCGYDVLDALTSLGGDHGPSDALFEAEFVIPFLGLDDTGPLDPEVAKCEAAGGGGGGGTAGSGAGSGGAPQSGSAGMSTGGAPSSNGGTGGSGPGNVGPGIVGGSGGVPSSAGTAPVSSGAASSGPSSASDGSCTFKAGYRNPFAAYLLTLAALLAIVTRLRRHQAHLG